MANEENWEDFEAGSGSLRDVNSSNVDYGAAPALQESESDDDLQEDDGVDVVLGKANETEKTAKRTVKRRSEEERSYEISFYRLQLLALLSRQALANRTASSQTLRNMILRCIPHSRLSMPLTSISLPGDPHHRSPPLDWVVNYVTWLSWRFPLTYDDKWLSRATPSLKSSVSNALRLAHEDCSLQGKQPTCIHDDISLAGLLGTLAVMEESPRCCVGPTQQAIVHLVALRAAGCHANLVMAHDLAQPIEFANKSESKRIVATGGPEVISGPMLKGAGGGANSSVCAIGHGPVTRIKPELASTLPGVVSWLEVFCHRNSSDLSVSSMGTSSSGLIHEGLQPAPCWIPIDGARGWFDKALAVNALQPVKIPKLYLVSISEDGRVCDVTRRYSTRSTWGVVCKGRDSQGMTAPTHVPLFQAVRVAGALRKNCSAGVESQGTRVFDPPLHPHPLVPMLLPDSTKCKTCKVLGGGAGGCSGSVPIFLSCRACNYDECTACHGSRGRSHLPLRNRAPLPTCLEPWLSHTLRVLEHQERRFLSGSRLISVHRQFFSPSLPNVPDREGGSVRLGGNSVATFNEVKAFVREVDSDVEIYEETARVGVCAGPSEGNIVVAFHEKGENIAFASTELTNHQSLKTGGSDIAPTATIMETLPTVKSDFKRHPVFALASELTKWEVLDPLALTFVDSTKVSSIPSSSLDGVAPAKSILGYFKGEPVYPRSAVKRCLPLNTWEREGFSVREDMMNVPVRRVEPRERVSASGPFPTTNSFKFDFKEGGKHAEAGGRAGSYDDSVLEELHAGSERKEDISESGLALYGEWQVEPLNPPAVSPHERLPTNDKYGSFEVRHPKCIPAGVAHLVAPGVEAAAKRLGLPYVPVFSHFERHGVRASPCFNGCLVHSINADTVLSAACEVEGEKIKKKEDKREMRVVASWEAFVRGLRIKQRLEEDSEEIGVRKRKRKP